MRIKWNAIGARSAMVYLNESPIFDVVEADEEGGFVMQHVRDAEGRLVHDGEQVRTVRRTGSVRIQL